MAVEHVSSLSTDRSFAPLLDLRQHRRVSTITGGMDGKHACH
jgi:hypothetical protein